MFVAHHSRRRRCGGISHCIEWVVSQSGYAAIDWHGDIPIYLTTCVLLSRTINRRVTTATTRNFCFIWLGFCFPKINLIGIEYNFPSCASQQLPIFSIPFPTSCLICTTSNLIILSSNKKLLSRVKKGVKFNPFHPTSTYWISPCYHSSGWSFKQTQVRKLIICYLIGKWIAIRLPWKTSLFSIL